MVEAEDDYQLLGAISTKEKSFFQLPKSNMDETDHVLPPELAADILDMEEQHKFDMNCKNTPEPSIVDEKISETGNSKQIQQCMYKELGVRLQADDKPQEEEFVDLELCSRKKRLLPNLVTNILPQANSKDELEFHTVHDSKLARSVFPQAPSTDIHSKPNSKPREQSAVDISIQKSKIILPSKAFVAQGHLLALQSYDILSKESQLSNAVSKSVVPNIPVTSSHALTTERDCAIMAPGIHQKVANKYHSSQARHVTLTKLKSEGYQQQSEGYQHPPCQKRHSAGYSTWVGPPCKKQTKDIILNKINQPPSSQIVQTSIVGSDNLEQSLPDFDQILDEG